MEKKVKQGKNGRIYIFDTTLRDGAQTQGIDFSVGDKLAISKILDDFGVDYIEGGWPGANPTDNAFFENPPELKNSKLVSFGMTRRAGMKPEEDAALKTVVESGAPVTCLVGKTWDFQVEVALGVSLEENLDMIRSTIEYACTVVDEVIFDAEHFFDGYKSNPEYTKKCLKAALDAGARWIVLCDTNGGTLHFEIEDIIEDIKTIVPGEKLGIHTHNDSQTAVANSLSAIKAGARMVQGTINGIGERCGNANLISIVPALIYKMGYSTGVSGKNLSDLTRVAFTVHDRTGRRLRANAPYVGRSAFAHKGGLHVSGVEKDPRLYEHIEPELLGNARKLVVSHQSGKAAIIAYIRQFGLEEFYDGAQVNSLLDVVKQKEFEGYVYDGCEASFEILARRHIHKLPAYFELKSLEVSGQRSYKDDGSALSGSTAKVSLKIGDKLVEAQEEGVGRVHAIDLTLRKALKEYYPGLKEMKLVDYRVGSLSVMKGAGTESRVFIESMSPADTWTTVGVSSDIVDASIEALVDSYLYYLIYSGMEIYGGNGS